MKFNYQTLSILTRRCLERLSMYKGTSVQTYAEDRIQRMILDQYNMVFDNFPWRCLTHWHSYTLSGTNGEVIDTVSNDIVDFSDIVAISPDTSYKRVLRRIHQTTVPDLLDGTTPGYYQEHPTNEAKVFQILPLNAIGTIYVCSKGRLNTNSLVMNSATVIPFDSDYLVYAVCVDYLGDDASSQLQYEKFTKLRDERIKQLKKLDNDGTIDYNDSMAYHTTTLWR